MPSLMNTYTCPPGVWTRVEEGANLWLRADKSQDMKLHFGALDDLADTYAPAVDTDEYMILEDYERSVSFAFADDTGLQRIWLMPMGNEPVKVIVAAF